MKRDAQIAQAEADRDGRRCARRWRTSSARSRASRPIPRSPKPTADYQSRKAEYDAAVNLKRAEADLAYDIQKNRTSQELKKEEIQISVIEKEQQDRGAGARDPAPRRGPRGHRQTFGLMPSVAASRPSRSLRNASPAGRARRGGGGEAQGRSPGRSHPGHRHRRRQHRGAARRRRGRGDEQESGVLPAVQRGRYVSHRARRAARDRQGAGRAAVEAQSDPTT